MNKHVNIKESQKYIIKLRQQLNVRTTYHLFLDSYIFLPAPTFWTLNAGWYYIYVT